MLDERVRVSVGHLSAASASASAFRNPSMAMVTRWGW